MMDFSNYEQGAALYALGNSVLPEIADRANYQLTDQPDKVNLQGLIAKLGPDKELQKNIGVVREALGDNATGQIADWVERSGIMYPVERSFMKPTAVPERADTVIINGGVANWMLRRAGVVLRMDPKNVGQVLLPIGNRQMGAAEHQLVQTSERSRGQRPTEAQFVEQFVVPSLAMAGFDVRLIPVESSRGDEVLDALLATVPSILDGTVIVAANAPNALQAAGELRLAGQRVRPEFDINGQQVHMVSDSIALARRGEAAKTHQNPATAVGQLGRNGLYLVMNGIVV